MNQSIHICAPNGLFKITVAHLLFLLARSFIDYPQEKKKKNMTIGKAAYKQCERNIPSHFLFHWPGKNLVEKIRLPYAEDLRIIPEVPKGHRCRHKFSQAAGWAPRIYTLPINGPPLNRS